MQAFIRKKLIEIIGNMDSGNSSLSDEEAVKIAEFLQASTDRQRLLSKYESCVYLRVSRATFDNYVRDGKIPKGIKKAGWKEKFWTEKQLKEFISKKKGGN